MFDLNLKDEEILMKMTSRKVITKKDIAMNFLGNLLTGAGGDIADNVNFILTKDSLYLEYKGHVSIGYAEETRDITKIDLCDLKEFLVTSKENEELIEIKTNKKDLLFVKDNKDNDSLALAMSNLINDIK